MTADTLTALCLLFAMSAGLVLLGLLTARACDAVACFHHRGLDRLARAERIAAARWDAGSLCVPYAPAPHERTPAA